jgi:glycosyltransferase involved in cell wall biosynthesis
LFSFRGHALSGLAPSGNPVEAPARKLLFLKLASRFDPTMAMPQRRWGLLSRHYRGDILAVVHKREFASYRLGRFSFRGLYLPRKLRYTNWARNLLYYLFSTYHTLRAHWFGERYEAIVAYDPLSSGMLAVFLGKLTGARIVIEVNGNYLAPSNWFFPKKTWKAWLRYKVVGVLVPFVLERAHAIKLLYESQLDPFADRIDLAGIRDHVYAFHNCVPIDAFAPAADDEKVVLFIGTPWYRKGADGLIQAFSRISPDFPEHRLKIVGFFSPEEVRFLSELGGGNEKFEFCGPLEYEEVVALMSRCALFVLPSRSEAMGRVLLEAMAAERPIVAARVDGIPTYIHDGETGRLFDPEDWDGLAERIREMLTDRGEAQRLGRRAGDYVRTQLDPETYAAKCRDLLEATCGGLRQRQ